MVFPTVNYATGKQNCPTGFTHVPHLFFEAYWNTQVFADRWTPNQGYQPFVLSNGDLSGCSAHGDFMAAWDTTVLQNIIDTCNAGDIGMDTCPGVTVRDKSTSCNVASPIKENILLNLESLPGNNPLVGWGTSYGSSGAATTVAASSASSVSASSATTTAASLDADSAAGDDASTSMVTPVVAENVAPVSATPAASTTLTKQCRKKRDAHIHAHAQARGRSHHHRH